MKKRDLLEDTSLLECCLPMLVSLPAVVVLGKNLVPIHFK